MKWLILLMVVFLLVAGCGEKQVEVSSPGEVSEEGYSLDLDEELDVDELDELDVEFDESLL